MTIEERVAHLANLTFIMDFHEKLGTTKNPLIVQEFNRGHEALVKALEEKEKSDETGNRKNDAIRAETRADQSGGKPQRSGPDRTPDIKHSAGADVRR